MATMNTLSNEDFSHIQLSSMHRPEGQPPPAQPQVVEEENKQEDEDEQMVGFFSLFRFATKTDIILIIIGSICAAVMGVALPAFAVLWGNMTNQFKSSAQMEEASKQIMFNFIYIGLGAFGAGWGMFACWMIAGEHQGIECRKAYLRTLLKQEIGWFDTINQSELATKFATDCFAFQGAIGQKVSTVIMTISMFIAGFVIAFVYGWLMSLVVLVSLPVIAIGGMIFASATENKDKEQEKDYSEAGGQVQQAISAIRTVKQLNGQQFQADKYAETLKDVTESSSKHGLYLGIGMGVLYFAMLASYSLGFWYGSHCVEGSGVCPPNLNKGKVYTAGDVLIVFFAILMAGFNLSQLTPAIKKIAEGRSAASRIFKIIDREPQIVNPENGIKLDNLKGVFKFENVSFAYPKDKKKNILNNLNLVIDSKFTAFVGESGCGKSTIFQLIMRFYDPDQGRITLDGVDLKELDLYWLRSQIGYVGQEPVLFATTLKENILFGNEKANDDDIMMALKSAEALDFVQKLKDKLETYVGTGGGQISGGQKQRIAIARALVKKPKILLLDEATSALDRRNQRLIQGTLNKIAEETITINIAHRIKTIMNCEHIFVMEQGKVAEQGRFSDLRRYKGMQMEKDEEIQSPTLAKQIVAQQAKQVKPVAEGQGPTEPEARAEGEAGSEAEDDELSENSKKKKKQEEELLEKYDDQIFGRLFAYASDKICLFLVGILLAIANGGVFPAFSIFLSKMLAVLVDFSVDPAKARTDANLYALIFLIIAVLSLVINILQLTIFSYIGEHITQKVRNQTYIKILRMPIAWFDKEKNSSGALSARLASDCSTVNGLITTYIAVSIQSLTTLLAGIIIAFIYEWRTSLVALGLLPLMIISGAIQMAFTQGFSDKTDKIYKQSANLITESMNHIRTVTSFGSEDIIERKYSQKLVEPMEAGVQKGIVSGLLYGLSQIIMFLTFGLIFWLGIVFMNRNNLQMADVFTAIFAIVFSGMTAGNNAHFMPDIGVGKKAAASIFEIQDAKDQDQLQVETSSRMLTSNIKGNIVFKNVSFKYESRDHQVLRELNFEISEGHKIGFVGPSGCGKSTIHQLLQRFYDVDEGQILIDDINIKDYDIHHLRASLGVVSQEPVLFNETIADNITYNRTNTNRDQIVNAANESNFNPEKDAIEVVNEPPKEKKKKKKADQQEEQTKKPKKVDGTGFEKNVGIKGSHISGGQKQRVAIARVIIRKPHLLLLDEATSALDSANEKIVQESLDRMMKDKTSISIAHRLDTIKNCDQIMVFHNGQIAEKGKFDELMARKGYFYNLQKGLQFV